MEADNKRFVIYIGIQKEEKVIIDLAKKALIKTYKTQAQVEALLFNKALIAILKEYFNYNNVFSMKNITKLLENSGINEHIIKLEKSKQLSFKLIYSLCLIELKAL